MTNSNTDLIENPTPRCACMLVLDVSKSMEGEKINELNEGAWQFLNEVRKDDFARYSVELGVVTFGGEVNNLVPFGPTSETEWQDFSASGRTPMGEAVDTAIDALESRKKEYKKNGVTYYQPWLVLMTDGFPTDDYINAAKRLQKMGDNDEIVTFGVGVGEDCDMSMLAKFCPLKRPPVKLSGLKFKEFFAWLSQSMACVSKSTPGMDVDLPPVGWGSIPGR